MIAVPGLLIFWHVIQLLWIILYRYQIIPVRLMADAKEMPKKQNLLRRSQSKDLWPMFLLYSHIYLSSIACLTKPDGNVRLATLYHAKMLRKNLDSELKARDARILTFFLSPMIVLIVVIHFLWYYEYSVSASMIRNRLMDVIMRILLPACFIALKLTGSFIDFMLGLANSSVYEDIEISKSQVRDSQLKSHHET